MNRHSDLALQMSNMRISQGAVIAILLGLCFCVGLSLGWVPIEVFIFGIVGIVIAGVCVRWPYVGLILYMFMEYMRPQERFPMLAPLHLTRLIAVVMIVGWLYRRRRDGFEIWVRSPENAGMIGLLVVVILSIMGAFWKMHAIEIALDFARIIAISILIPNLVNTPKRLQGFLYVFVALNVYLSGEQLWNYFTHGPMSDEILRVGSSSGSFLGEDGDFSLALGVALPFAYFMVWSQIKPVLRALSGVAVMMFICSVMATGSRCGAVGLAAVLLTLVLRSKRKLIAGCVLLIMIITFWVAAPQSYKTRMESIVGSHDNDLTAQSRIVSWNAAKKMFADYPFLGVGVGNFLDVFVAHYGGSYSWSRTVHNVYYQAASELGVCGLIAFAFLVGCVLIRSLKLNVSLNKAGYGGTPMAVCASALLPATVAYLVTGAFQTPLYYPHLYLIAAIAVSVNNITRPIFTECDDTEATTKWNRKSPSRRFTRI